MEKSKRHAAIRERAADAIRNLYHNATPRYPYLEGDEAEAFQSWFDDAAQYEMEYLRDGGAYGGDYAGILRSNASRNLTTEAQRRYYVRWHLRSRDEERARCNRLDSRHALTNAMWERIGEYGSLYQYGRGGRTLAPDELIQSHGGSSFAVREDYADNLPIADVVTVIRIVESFNRYVAGWCRDVPEMWAEYRAEAKAEKAEAEATAMAEDIAASRPDLQPAYL